MRKILDTIRSKRGIAIELAVFVILLTTALSMIILSIAMQESKLSLKAKEDLKNTITTSEIGEMALAGRQNTDSNKYEFTMGEYIVSCEKNGSGETLEETVTVKLGETFETIITIKLRGGIILSWD